MGGNGNDSSLFDHRRHPSGRLSDVTDARSSLWRPGEKLEILKDPHVGAFAVIGCGIYLLAYAGFFS